MSTGGDDQHLLGSSVNSQSSNAPPGHSDRVVPSSPRLGNSKIRDAENASLSPSDKVSYYSFPNPESEHTLATITRGISKQAGSCNLSCFLGAALLLLLGTLIAIAVCLALVPFPRDATHYLSSDDELLVQQNGIWMSGLDTFGPKGLVVDQYVGAPPVMQPIPKVISYVDINMRMAESRSEMFRFYLYPQSAINVTWAFGINSQISVTLLRGREEYTKFVNNEEYAAIAEKDSDRNSLVYTVTQLEEYYVIIWSTSWVTSFGVFSLNVQSKTFNRSNRVTSCQGNCTFSMAQKTENYFLLIAPSRGINGQVSTEYAVPFSEIAFSEKFLALYLTLGLFSMLLLVGVVAACVKQKPYRGWAKV